MQMYLHWKHWAALVISAWLIMLTGFPSCLLCKPVSQGRGQRDPEVSLSLGTATCAAGLQGRGGSQVNDIKPRVPSQPYLIMVVCGINLGLERRKSLNGRDCIKISGDKEKKQQSERNPLQPFCPLPLPLCLSTDKSSPWSGGLINDGKTAWHWPPWKPRHTPTQAHTHTDTGTHTHTHTHTRARSQPGNRNYKKAPVVNTCCMFQGHFSYNNQDLPTATAVTQTEAFRLRWEMSKQNLFGPHHWLPANITLHPIHTHAHTQKHLNSKQTRLIKTKQRMTLN